MPPVGAASAMQSQNVCAALRQKHPELIRSRKLLSCRQHSIIPQICPLFGFFLKGKDRIWKGFSSVLTSFLNFFKKVLAIQNNIAYNNTCVRKEQSISNKNYIDLRC